MNKQERKKILSNKIMDTNSKLNEQYKLCNLHIRNIPYHAKEEDIIEAFKKFGEIKSVKIEKLILVTKENNEIKEIPTSKGFGYICFEEPQSAQRALEEMNDKFLPKFETWKRPLIIEYFMPKMQRTPVVVDKINQTSVFNTGKFSMIYGQNPSSYGMQPVQPGMMNFPPQMMNYAGGMNPQMYKPQRNYQQPYRQQHHQQPYQQQYQPQQQTVNNPPQKRIIVEKKEEEEEKDELDYKYLESLDYESKKDYLGEFIFKKIENHKLSQNNSLTIDMIGKITGMILGIEDISEIIEIYRSSENLTARITEALDLITKN
jgi:RNA recognition motif-containing protein